MNNIKILLLEKVHPLAEQELLESGASQVDYLEHSLSKPELLKIIADYHIIGIRSNTFIDAEVLAQAKNLLAIGCFCIGTNQVDSKAAKEKGVVVFNSPYANTRSVAELVIAEIVFLMRGISYRDKLAHKGQWLKNATDSYEVRGKIFGIVGYGNIGSQVGLLAEAMGMQVIFYDIQKKLPLGNAKSYKNLHEMLGQANVVSLHVPKTARTIEMLDKTALQAMQAGSYLINAARGDVIDIEALKTFLISGHIKGAALDVFPVEPKSNDDTFVSPLQEMDNVILTPHIGGSTKESQQNIALDVASKLVDFVKNGNSMTAVDFPNLSPSCTEGCIRFLQIHCNKAGALEKINGVFAQQKINIRAFSLQTDNEVGYAMIEVENTCPADKITECKNQLLAIEHTIATRIVGNI